MTQIHTQEKEQFKKLFKNNLLDRFEERYAILESFLQTEEHITAGELRQQLQDKGHPFELDTIRDTLKIMCRFGFAQENRFDDGNLRYEHRHLGYHHDHLICTKCKQVTEFTSSKMEQLQMEIAAANGFHMLQHRMEIYGICNRCLGDRKQQLSLALTKPGEQLTLQDIIGGKSVRMRLSTMGLRVGDDIRVITNDGRGQLVVGVDQKRYVLGREMARKILVQLTER
jgi:Fur family ferric uptake transcriptional regulator